MKLYRFPDSKVAKILFALTLLVILLLTRDSMNAMLVPNYNVLQFVQLGVICVVGCVFLAVNIRDLKSILLDKRMLMLLLSTLVILLPMVIKGDWQLMYFSVLLCLYFAVFLTYFISWREIAKYYVVTITVIGAYSIVCTYLLKWLVIWEILPVQVIPFQDYCSYFNFGLTYVRDWPDYFRNSGIFREPGVYQFFLILALYLNNYELTWSKKRLHIINGILAVTMLTTISTVGYIEMVLFAAIIFFEKKMYRNKRTLKLVIALVIGAYVAMVALMLMGGPLGKTLYYMVKKLFVITHSSGSRYSSILVDAQLFFRSPLWGCGMAEVLHAVTDNTSSTMILFAVFGIFGGALNVAAWVALVWNKNRAVWVNLALLVVLFMSFNTQNLITNIFFWLFPYMALTERCLPLLGKKSQ